MKKNIIRICITILLVVVASDGSLGSDSPVWWPQAVTEAENDRYALTTPEDILTLGDSNQDHLILDVRPDYEYESGHIPDAENFEIHLGDRLDMKLDRKEAFRKVLGPDQNRIIVIYCRSFR
jgi:3-mercaptopyruvate sulfurtransferase SseA